MKDVQTVLEAYRAGAAGNLPCALATVVSVEGSAYRRPGARMLVYADGRRFGSLSGGCLEADVAAHAQHAMAAGQPTLLRYDPRSTNGDMILETGCKGAIGILVEPITLPDTAPSLDFLTGLLQQRQYGDMATVFEIEGVPEYRIGERLLFREGRSVGGALQGSPLERAVLQEFTTLRPEEKSRVISIRLPQGVVHLLLESLVPPIALLLCGSGHDTTSLAKIAAAMGWQVTVADPNGSALTTERYPDAQSLLPVRPECLTTQMALDPRTAAVLMTHRYALDLEWFRHLLPTPLRYLGLLGPRRRWQQMQQDLAAEGDIYPEADLIRVHSPAGLDIGSETPEEIALAIVAEISAVMNARSGGSLRQRDVPIHSSVEMPLPVRPYSLQEGIACPLSAS